MRLPHYPPELEEPRIITLTPAGEEHPTEQRRMTQQLLNRAEKAGAHIGALCQAMHRNLGEEAVRRILGVLNLVKKYGVASTDEACALGLETGASHYHFAPARRAAYCGPIRAFAGSSSSFTATSETKTRG